MIVCLGVPPVVYHRTRAGVKGENTKKEKKDFLSNPLTGAATCGIMRA